MDTASNTGFRYVQAAFNAPSVNCALSPLGSSGFAQVMPGVGLGGWLSQGTYAEEVGFAAGCNSAGQYKPYVWYYTAVTGLVNEGFVGTVQSGDALLVAASYSPTSAGYTLRLTDLTRPTVQFTQLISNMQCKGECDNTSAEVITQVFDGLGFGFNLADFGALNFAGAHVINLSGYGGGLASNQKWQATDATLVNPATSDTLAVPSTLAGGTTYTDSWLAAR